MRADENIDLMKQVPWKTKLPKRFNSTKIRAYVFQARDLPSADDDGLADPKVRAFSSIEKSTKGDKTVYVET